VAKEIIEAFLVAFQDMRVIIEEVVAEEDRVDVQYS
jgi:hypothetical protein